MDLSSEITEIIVRALNEDIADGDVTTLSTILPAERFYGEFISRQDGVIAGLDITEFVFNVLDRNVEFSRNLGDGSYVNQGEVIASVIGSGRALLSGERVALNLLQRMSGIATITRKFVEATCGTKATILDTRKTVPGLRVLDKLAVSLGGGQNHRQGLYDMILVKENHIEASGSISEAVERVRRGKFKDLTLEVEVKTILDLEEAIDLNLDRILLDNMDLQEMTEAVNMVDGRVSLEASGNITLDTVEDVACTGVDFISVGMLTHSVKALDISFLLKPRI